MSNTILAQGRGIEFQRAVRPMTASTNIGAYRVVAVHGDAGDRRLEGVRLPLSADIPVGQFGVTEKAVRAGDEVDVRFTGTAKVYASGAIARGAFLQATGTGAVTTATSGKVVGRARASAVDGEILEIDFSGANLGQGGGGSGGGGGASLGTDVPLAPGTAAAGTSVFASHDDHVHPPDPNTATNTASAAAAAAAAAAAQTTADANTGDIASLDNTVTGFGTSLAGVATTVGTIGDAVAVNETDISTLQSDVAALGVPDPATDIPIESDDDTGSVGVGTKYARDDHKHPLSPVMGGGSAGAAGTKGLVPAPPQSGTTTYLDSTGNWSAGGGGGGATEVDSTGAATGDLAEFNTDTGLLETAGAKIPTTFTAGYLNQGKLHLPNGSVLTDRDVEITLQGTAPPTISDGWDGAYWVNTTTGLKYGPKATTWPAPTQLFLPDANNHKLRVDLDLNGMDLVSGDGVTVIHPQTIGTDESLEVGLWVIVGETGQPVDYVMLRPWTAAVNADMRAGGKGTGKLRTIVDGHEYAHAGWEHFVASRHTDVTTLTSNSNIEVRWAVSGVYNPENEANATFTISGGDVGAGDTYFTTVQFPADGTYELTPDVSWNNGSGNAGDMRMLIGVGGSGGTLRGGAIRWADAASGRRDGIRPTYTVEATTATTVIFYLASFVGGSNNVFQASDGALTIKRIR